MAENENYGKRPLWQWVLIYLVIGAIAYGLIYYFFLGNRGENNSGGSNQTEQNSQPNNQSY